jgi:hypothetical protein
MAKPQAQPPPDARLVIELNRAAEDVVDIVDLGVKDGQRGLRLDEQASN